MTQVLVRVFALLLLIAPTLLAGDDDIEITKFLTSTGAAPGAKAETRWRDKGDALDFQVELEDIASGTYQLFVAGVPRGDIVVAPFGEGELEFKVPLDPPKPLFDFAVFGELIEVRQAGITLFSDTFPGDPSAGGPQPGGANGPSSKIEVFMTPSGLDANAKGRLRYRAKDGVTRFDAEFERLDAGSYSLRVGGLEVASFVATGAFGEEIEFEFRDPVEPGHLPLTFDPLGALVEVDGQAGTVLIAVMPGSVQSSGVKPPSSGKKNAKDIGKAKRDALRVTWSNPGVVAGATGEIELEQAGSDALFVMKASGLVAGPYIVTVDAVNRGELVVSSNGQAEMTFSTTPSGDDQFLDFALKGRLMELRSGSTVVLASVFPLSVQHALDRFVAEKTTPTKSRRNLVNAGSDLDALGVVTTVTKGDVTRVRFVVRDLPVGVHTLRIGGVDAGTVDIAKSGQRLRLVLSTSPKGKQLPLPVDPTGAIVEVVAGTGDVLVVAELP